MENFLSVWLVPQKNDEKELTSIIDNLAKENDSPVFTPHLTLIGNTNIGFEDVKSAVDEVFANQKPFTIKTQKVSKSELFFKTVFIEFDINETLRNLFQAFSERTDKRSIDNFKPHISLVYKIMPEDEKTKIINSLNIKDEYTIGGVYIVAPKEGDADFLDVEGWRILYKKKLNN